MSNVVFIGTFDPLHGGHIGQLMRAYSQLKFTHALILIDKYPLHKPNASHWSHRLRMAELGMKAFKAPFKCSVLAVESSNADEINHDITYKITGIDSFLDNISDPQRWELATRWNLLVLSIPGIRDATLDEALANTPAKLISELRYTFVSETDAPIMNYDFSHKELSKKRVHSTYVRSGKDIMFIPQTVQNYIRANNIYD